MSVEGRQHQGLAAEAQRIEQEINRELIERYCSNLYDFSVCAELETVYKDTSRTMLTSLTALPAKSSKTGIRSISSLSCASENQLLIGTAC